MQIVPHNHPGSPTRFDSRQDPGLSHHPGRLTPRIEIPYLLASKLCRHVPGKIAPVIEQLSELDHLSKVAAEQKVPQGYKPLADHASSAGFKVIDKIMGGKVRTSLCTRTRWLFQHVA